MVAYILALLVSLATLEPFGSEKYERALAGLYILLESSSLMVQVTGSDIPADARRVYKVIPDELAPVMEPGWTRQARWYVVVIERPSCPAADGMWCQVRAHEFWYIACHQGFGPEQNHIPACQFADIYSMCCATSDISNESRCEE